MEPRRQVQETPRGRRGSQPASRQAAVNLARKLAGKQEPEPAEGTQRAANQFLTRSGAWRFRRHTAPFFLLAGLIAAAAGLHATTRPVLWGILAGFAVPGLLSAAARVRKRGHEDNGTRDYVFPKFVRVSGDVAAVYTGIWLPLLAATGVRPHVAWLLGTWAPLAGLWVRHYRWRPPPPGEQPAAPAEDLVTWEKLAAERKWNAELGPAEKLPGGGRRYPIRCDGIKTTIGTILSASENVAGAWHKPMTEAYAERDPHGITSRGLLTILGRETLMIGREWDGTGIDELTGTAVIGRYADGRPVHVKFYTPRYGTRHALISGTTGSGKSELLNLLIFVALVSGRFVPVVLDPQEGQSLPFWRDRCLYAAGVDECHRMLRGLHAGMLDRSQYLASLPWEDDGISMRGMPFFDYDLTGLPMPLIFFDEAHMALKGGTRAERDIVEKVTEIGRLARKTGTGLWLATHLPSLQELGGEQALRDMLRGGNVVSMRTANRVAGGMLGLEKDPSEIPSYFADGKETYGLGYAAGPDNRPDAPMRSDIVPKAMRRAVPAVPLLDDRFRAAMDAAMGAPSPTAAFPVPSSQVPSPVPEGDGGAPDGKRCVDAVWKVLDARRADMGRGEIIKWVNDLAVAWEREPWNLRSITNALGELTAAGKVVKPNGDKGGVYRAVTTQETADTEGN